MPIRIMHVVDTLGKGGLENSLVNLIERLDPNHFEHTVCAIRGLGANAGRLPRERVRVMCLAKKDTDSAIQVAKLARTIRDIRPDVVHSRNWGAIEAVPAGRWARGCGLIHSEHGLDSNTPAKEPKRRTWFRRLAFELADRVLTVSYQLRDVHAARTGFPARKISVIHNGVDSQKFRSDAETRARVRQELGLSDDEFCIGCVGNLFPVKDHMTLLHAAAGLAASSNAWRLLMIGEGPERTRLEDFVNGHAEWKSRVRFLGSSHRVTELLNAMDVYVLPSLMEGISNSLLEAMATGLPVIATHTGGNPEVVVDGESGLLFPVGDARRLTDQLLALGERKDQRAQLGQQALRRVREEFSLDAMVRNYEQLYESVTPAVASRMAVAQA